MFAASKPLASLSSGLLARKGQARPAMRPQGYASLSGMGASPLEDLGWNDMGSAPVETPEPSPAPAPAAEPVVSMVTEAPVAPVPVPAVLTEREALKEEIEAPLEAPLEAPRVERPVSVATATRLARESAHQTKKGKAAFTLRLDGERHLRLRLASALSGRSAQALVTGAVDELLKSLPEVELLVGQLPPAKKSSR